MCFEQQQSYNRFVLAYQGPTPLNFCHEGAARIPLAAVFAPAVVAGAHHLVVDDHVDALVPVPKIFYHKTAPIRGRLLVEKSTTVVYVLINLY